MGQVVMQRVRAYPEQGEPYLVEITSRDVFMWEKTNRGASFGRLKDDLRMADMYAVSYQAATRQHLYVGTLADWESTMDLEILGDEDQEDGVDPTRPGVSPGT